MSTRILQSSVAGCFIALSFGAASGPAMAVTNTSDPISVLSRIHEINQAEISTGELAKSRGSNKAVKSFGEQMIKEHRDADKQINDLAAKKKFSLSQKVDSDDLKKEQDLEAQLKAASGPAFDSLYAKAMRDGHLEAIAMLDDASRKLQDQDVKDLVDNILPTVKHHETMAQALLGQTH